MLPGAVAVLAASLHGLYVAVLILGPVAVACRPRLARYHLVAVVAMLAVTLSGSDCPLTTIEKHFREVAGWSVYRNGFISHYLVEPFHPAGITSGVRIVIIAAWIVPNILGYGLAFRNVRRRPASCPETR